MNVALSEIATEDFLFSPIQPTWVPANCKFEVDDVELEWEYDDVRHPFLGVLV
jgi:hypothetical protein